MDALGLSSALVDRFHSLAKIGVNEMSGQNVFHSHRCWPSSWAVALTLAVTLPAYAEITVDTGFEGASAKVVSVSAQTRTVRIMPAGDPKNGWPCWWYLRVNELTVGERLTLEVVPSTAPVADTGVKKLQPLPGYWTMPRRATMSTDGKTWRHTDLGQVKQGHAIYSVPVEAESMWLAWGPPFTPKDSAELIKELTSRGSWAEGFELAKSRGGRPCPALRLREGQLPADERPAIWIQARQHAWETGSSWVCRGLAQWLCSDDGRAKSLRERSEIYLVPIMDIDRTAAGEGGKKSLPHGHNRDWTDEPYYPEVAAAQRHLKSLSDAGRLALFVDLHNPGPFERQPFFFVCPEADLKELGRRNQDRFLSCCSVEMTGPLDLSEKPRVSDSTYDPLFKRMSKNWVVAHAPPHTVAVTLETSWNTRHGTTDGYQTLGTQLGFAIERYLRDVPRER